MVEHAQPANHVVHMGQRLEERGTVPVLLRHGRMVRAWLLAQVENLLPRPSRLANHAIHWREPSTVWISWPLIGFVSDTDFVENGAQHPPEEVGFRNFPPMWSFPPATIHGNHENITFGMDLAHINPEQTEKDALQAQCPIVCFKASTSTEMQDMGS